MNHDRKSQDKSSLFLFCSLSAIRSMALLGLLPLTLLTLTLLTGPAPAQQRQMHPAFAERIALENRQKKALDFLEGMAAGRIPFDSKQARSARRILQDTSKKRPKAYRKPLVGLQSHALPAVWLTPKDFEARAKVATKAAKGIRTRNAAQLRKTLPPMVHACLSCHTSYRDHDREFITH